MTPKFEAIFNLETSDPSIVTEKNVGSTVLKEVNEQALAGQVVILGISMNNIKLAEGQLFAALERLHRANVKKVVMVTGGELMSHSIAAQHNVLTLIADAISDSNPIEYVCKMGAKWKSAPGIKTPQDKHIVGSAHTIGDLWAAEPGQKAAFDEMKKRGLDFEIKHWHHFSSKYDFDSFVAQIALAYYKPEDMPEEFVRILSALPGPQRETLPEAISKRIPASTSPRLPVAQNPISIKYDPEYVDSVNSVAITHLLKHTRHETRKLQSLINTVLAPTTKNPQTSIELPSVDSLYSSQGEAKISPSIIQFLASSTHFLCKQFGIPSSSPLYYSQELHLQNTQDIYQQLLASWLLLVNISETCSPKDREALLKKLRDPAYNQLIREILTTKAPAKKRMRSMPSESECLSFTEQESTLIKKYSKKQVAQLKVESFVRKKERAEKIEALAKELDIEIANVLKFMQTYVSELNTESFFLFAHNLMKLNEHKAILKRYIKNALSENSESVSDLNELMVKEIFEGHKDVSYEHCYENLKTIFYDQKNEMFVFLAKLRFAEPEKQKNIGQFLSIVKIAKTRLFEDNKEAIKEFRDLLFAHFMQTGLAQELQVKFLLFEKAYENSPQFILQFYLHALLLSKQFVKETFNASLTSVIYEYLNKLFVSWDIKLPEDNSKLIPISQEQLAQRCEDTIFRILIESSIAYILEECGGFQFIARELDAGFFAYPELIIDALWLAREKVFATRGDGNFCADQASLLRCLTYYLVPKAENTPSSMKAKPAICDLSEQPSSSSQPPKSARTASNSNSNSDEELFTEEELADLKKHFSDSESISMRTFESGNFYKGLSYDEVLARLTEITNSGLKRAQEASSITQQAMKMRESLRKSEGLQQKQNPSQFFTQAASAESAAIQRSRRSVATPERMKDVANFIPADEGLHLEFRDKNNRPPSIK